MAKGHKTRVDKQGTYHWDRFLSTLLDVAGVEKPEGYKLDAQSLLQLFKSSDAKRSERPLYWHFPGYPTNFWRTGPVSVIRSGPSKLIKFYETNEIKLYNLKNDISENP